MDKNDSIVAIYPSHTTAEAAIKELQQSGFDMEKPSMLGRDYHTDESASHPGCSPVSGLVNERHKGEIAPAMSTGHAQEEARRMTTETGVNHQMTRSVEKFSLILSEILVATIVFMFTSSLGAAVMRPAGRPSDADIAHWVQDAIHHDPRCQASDCAVHVENGIATLTGTTPTLAGKRFADLETKKIQGVRAVLNEIAVQPAARDDRDIASDIRRRILDSATIESHDVQVYTMKGAVTLAGSVATLTEFIQAGLLASEVRGVKEVTNKLTVEFISHRSDQELKEDAVAALNRNVYLSGLPITVEVHEGVISVDGSVGSAYEKDRAADAINWLAGVKRVTNRLNVEPAENRGTRKLPASYTDEQVRQAVLAALRQDSRIITTNIAVTVTGGFVTLTGDLPNHLQARIAEQDAHDVIGVAWVTKQLQVRPPTRKDKELAADVLFAIDTDARLAGQGIRVKVENAVATLTGSVTGWDEKNHAQDVVLRIRGLKTVINDLTISRSGKVVDGALAQAIGARLSWNSTTRWVAADITVAVKNGIASLTGNVASLAEWREAERVAFRTAGIWMVQNQLSVQGRNAAWPEWDYRNLADFYDDDASNR